jgi:hypothetical protein
MAAKKTVTYECEVCGTEVTVVGEGVSTLEPIYCCGISLGGGVRSKKKPAKKVAAAGTARKKTASKTAAKKRSKEAPRRTAKKSTSLTRTKK